MIHLTCIWRASWHRNKHFTCVKDMHLNTMKDKYACAPLGSYTDILNAFVYICTSFVTSDSKVTEYCPWADVRMARKEWFLQFFNKALYMVGRGNVKKHDAPRNKWAAMANCFGFWWLQRFSRALSMCSNFYTLALCSQIHFGHFCGFLLRKCSHFHGRLHITLHVMLHVSGDTYKMNNMLQSLFYCNCVFVIYICYIC